MRDRHNGFLLPDKPEKKAKRVRRRERESYFTRRQAWLSFITAPVLAIGVVVGGLSSPAFADTATPVPTPAATGQAKTATANSSPSDSNPTDAPATAPTDQPTAAPTAAPTTAPASTPTQTPNPTDAPTAAPTDTPTSAPTAVPTPTPTQQLHAQALKVEAAGPVLQCQPGYVYSVQSGGTVKQVDPSGTVTTFGGAGWSNLDINSANGLGISAGGATMYAYNRDGSASNVNAILKYTQASGAWVAVPNSSYTTGINGSLVTGAVDLATGNYLYGGYTFDERSGQYQFDLFQFNTTTDTNSTVGYFNTGITGNGTNGDMAFDSAGNLYIVASGNSTQIFTVTAAALQAALSNPGSSTVIAATGGNQGSINIGSVNGIAFDADGTVYLGNGTTMQHYNPTTWAQIGGDVTDNLGNSTDLASCNSPASLTVQKDLPHGRVMASDQFTLGAAHSGTSLGTATTDGPATGLQTTVLTVPAVSTLTYSFSEALATRSGSPSLSGAYTTTWSCTGAQASGTGTSGTVTIPSGSGSTGAQVVCTFTNTPLTNTVTLTKKWVSAVNGDSTTLAIGGTGVTGAVGGSSTAGGTTTPATATGYFGGAVELSENLTSHSGATYGAAYSCTQAGTSWTATGASFTLPTTAGQVNCTVTNTNLQTYGTFSVTKKVTGTGAGLVSPNTSFTVDYSYVFHGTTTTGTPLTVTPGGTATSPNIPTGAVVTLSEGALPPITGGTWGTPSFSTNGFAIGNGTNVPVTLTNPITLDMGSFTVQKVVAGSGVGAVPSGTTFKVDWSYPARSGIYPAGSGSITLTPGQTSAAVNAPVGAEVTLTEETPATLPGITWTSTGVFSPASPITIGAKGSTVAVTVTNTASLNTGKFSILKQLSGDTGQVPAGTQFTVHYTYPAGNGFLAGSGDITGILANGVAVASGPIPEGAVVTLSEPNLPPLTGGTWGTPTWSPSSTVTIGDGTTAKITLTNPVSAKTGGFEVTKDVTGTGAGFVPLGSPYTINYEWAAGADNTFPAGSGSITVDWGGGAVPVTGVPVGATVHFTENTPPAIDGVTFNGVAFSPQTATITGTTSLVSVTATNTYTMNVGSFTISKSLMGTGAYLVPTNTEYTVNYSYTGGVIGTGGTGSVQVQAGSSKTVSGLPEGAVVTFSEGALPTIPGGTWGTPTFYPTSVTIGTNADVQVSLTNTITEIKPTLRLSKTVAGNVVSPDNWTLTGAPGTPGTSPTVTGNGSTPTVSIDSGVSYNLTEAPVSGFDASEFSNGTWSCTDASGGTVTVTEVVPGTSTLAGLKAGQVVSCTIQNSHVNQGVALAKTVHSTSQNVGGTWTIVYDVTVTNKSKVASTTYNLNDTLNYGSGITVDAATWTGPTTGVFVGNTATLATGQTIAAKGVDTYTVTVVASVSQSAWAEGTTGCTTTGGGFFNSAHVVSGPTDTTASACSEPATLSFSKVADGTPTWDATTGNWIVKYTLTVTNASSQAQYYQLTDTPKFAPGATLVGDPTVTKNGTSIPWNNGALAAVGTPIAAGGQTPAVDTYEVTAVVSVANVAPDAPTQCSGAGTGFFNSATLTTGTVNYPGTACEPIPTTTITHAKTVVAGSVAQAADGTWGIQYTITVTNTGKVGGVYSLADALRYGAGITAGSASWTGPTNGSWPDLPGNPNAQLALNEPIAAGATQTYTVTVKGIAIGAGVIGSTAGTCPAQGSTDLGGLNNDAVLVVGGVPTDSTACATPSNPLIQKHFVSAVQDPNNADVWSVSYTVTVNNSAGTNTNYYTLSDTPGFADGVSIDGVTVDGAPVAISGGSVPIVTTPTAIAAGATKAYTLVFTVTVADSTSALKCTGEPGGGFFNSATLTVGADAPGSSDCGNIANKVNPDVAKTVKSVSQAGDGTWNIVYDVTVTQPATGPTNPNGVEGKYSLTDTLDFGAGLTVNTASWALNGGSSNAWGDFTKAEQLATGRTIDAGATDTYQVSVNANVTQSAVSGGTDVCKPDSSTPSGFLNTAQLTAGSNTTNVSACASPAVPDVLKTLNRSIQNPDGTWTLSYNLTVGNPNESTAALAKLVDQPQPLPKGVTAVGNWSATPVGNAPAPVDASWAQGSTGVLFNGQLAAGAVYTYTVTVTVKVSALPASGQTCNGEPTTGAVVNNLGAVSSGQVAQGSEACGVVHFYDLGIAKSFTLNGGASTVPSGSNAPINYTLKVTNNGEAVDGATVTDPMPAGVTLNVSSISAVAGWNTAGSSATEFKAVHAGTLAAGATATFTFVANVGTLPKPPDGVHYPDIVNQACVAITGMPGDGEGVGAVGTGAIGIAGGKVATPAADASGGQIDEVPGNNCSSVHTPVTPVPPTPPAPPKPVTPGTTPLANTGSNVLPLGGIGAGLLLLGLAILAGWLWRRRHGEPS